MKRRMRLVTFMSLTVASVIMITVAAKVPRVYAGDGTKKVYFVGIKKASGITEAQVNSWKKEFFHRLVEKKPSGIAVIDEDAVKIMYKQLEDSQRLGMEGDAWLRRIEKAKQQEGIDYLVYGEITKNKNSYTINFQRLDLEPNNSQTGSSFHENKLSETNISHYLGEAASKMLDSGYQIRGPEDELTVPSALKKFNIKPGNQEALIRRMMQFSLAELKKGDDFYKKGSYWEAQEIYVAEIRRVNTKVPQDLIAQFQEYLGFIRERFDTVEASGRNYLEHRVRGFLEAATYLNFEERSQDAQAQMEQARDQMETMGGFLTPAVLAKYDEMANFLQISSFETSRPSKTVGGIKFVRIPGGCYLMGSEDGDSSEEEPVHRVCVKPFWMAKYEITQEQYTDIMGENPSRFQNCGGNCPVEEVSWNAAQKFIKKFNARYKTKIFLPSEAQWEYAARAGTRTEYYWGDSSEFTIVNEYAVYDKNSCDKGESSSEYGTHRVGSKKPNAFGLYDMSGNVWECLEDCYNNSYNGAPTDGTPWRSGNCETALFRGGSWYGDDDFLGSADRNMYSRDSRYHYFGFRVALAE